MDEDQIKSTTGKARCVSGYKYEIVVFMIGVLLSLCGVILRPVLNDFIQNEIDEQLVLKPDSQVYTAWLAPGGEDSVSMYTKFYLFDVKNYFEIHNGARPVVEQRTIFLPGI